jgi:hypothetical protein
VSCSWYWNISGKFDDVDVSCNMKCLRWDSRKKFKPGPRSRWRSILKLIFQSEGLKTCAETLSPVAGCCEHCNEHSGSIIWKNFLTIWVTESFLRSSGVKFHFTFPHTCSTRLKFYLLLCMTCWCVIIFFREMSLFLMAGEAGFGPARDVISTALVRVTVSLVTAITNWSAMVPGAFLRSPWLR